MAKYNRHDMQIVNARKLTGSQHRLPAKIKTKQNNEKDTKTENGRA